MSRFTDNIGVPNPVNTFIFCYEILFSFPALTVWCHLYQPLWLSFENLLTDKGQSWGVTWFIATKHTQTRVCLVAVGGFDFLMWFKLMDEQEICGLGVDVCVCAERMEKGSSFRVRLKYFFSSLLARVCACAPLFAYVCLCVHMLWGVDSCKRNGRCCNHALLQRRWHGVFPLDDNSPWKFLESMLK